MKHLGPFKGYFLYTIILMALSFSAIAQPGCPAVSAGNPVTLACGTPCTTLTATPFQVGATTSYSVNSIPYTPFSYTTGTVVSLGQDDYWGDTINLPFNFCFFGQVYNQAVVGANGIVTFSTYRALQYNPWSLTACSPVPDANPNDSAFTNTIMCPYQDIDPALGGTIKYQIIGTAPCRILVVSYNAVPMFNTGICPGEDCTCQMAIYETTNAIEIYIKAKQTCSAWNGGLAIEGIMDPTGTIAYTVPGRNLTAWAATNDAYRFTPNGPSIVNVSWFNGATQLTTNDSTVNVCPSTTTTYTAKAVYTPCAGGTPVTVMDSVTVSLGGSLNAGVDSFKNISCFGLADGKAYAHVSGGTSPVTYGWSNGSSSLSITNLAAGTYVFTANDAGGCVRADTVVITQPTRVGITGQVTNPGCTGTCGGSVATIDTGGTGGVYTYLWSTSPAQTTQTATGLCSGPVSVTVTDVNSCTASASFTLGTSTPVSISQVALTNATCSNNGSIVVSASGGNGVFNFQWSNNESGSQDTALAAGNYIVTATDTSGCSATATFTITQPANGISLQAPNITNILCAGGDNGSIKANASGGTGTLTYSWTEVSDSASLSGVAISSLTAGTYQLTVTDANGCKDTTSYTLASPPPLVIDSLIVFEATCGQSNGSAQIYVSGGTGNDSYKWSASPTVTTSFINGLPGGIYTVTITDAVGCVIQDTFGIARLSPMVISLVNQTNNLCFGDSAGSLTVTVSGGTSPYFPQWSNGASLSLQDSNLAAGNYDVIISDANGCTASSWYTITQPAAVTIGAAIIQNVGCSGGSTGSITAHVTGGTGPYTYSWVEQSNQQNFSGQSITNLGADVYYLTVTDANGCSASVNYVVLAVPPLVYTIDSTNVTCFDGTNGSVTVAISSGSPPYQYLFDNTGSIDSVYSNLSAGLVDVIVKDANNCTGHAIINIQQPTQIIIHQVSLTNVLCYGGDNGGISISATGGTPGYFYNWSNNFTGTTDTIITAGNYTITVTDSNACTVSQTYQITQPATALTVAPIIKNALCNGAADGSIDANPSGGTSPYTFLWSDGNTTHIAAGLTSGSYSCTVTDNHGCSVTTVDSIAQPTHVQILTDSAIAVRCISQKNGEIIMNAIGGTPPYLYNATKDNSNFVYTTNGVILGLDTGTYIVTLADSLGCTTRINVYVPPATLDSFATSVDSTLCYGPNYNDGAALATPLPPSSILNGPYKYGIDNSPESSDTGYFQNLSAGPHIITAINTRGCVDSIPVFVPEPLPMSVTITPDSISLPLGGSQQVIATVVNGNNPVYNWSPSTGLSCVDCPDPIISVYAPGDYLLSVSMVNGGATCYATATLDVKVQRHTRAYTPNAFTPNGDGNNDVFLIYGEDIKTISLRIFNRWGEKVFETTNSLAGWDGTYKGVMQEIGVYTYESVITYLDNSQETKNGTITLIR